MKQSMTPHLMITESKLLIKLTNPKQKKYYLFEKLYSSVFDFPDIAKLQLSSAGAKLYNHSLQQSTQPASQPPVGV